MRLLIPAALLCAVMLGAEKEVAYFEKMPLTSIREMRTKVMQSRCYSAFRVRSADAERIHVFENGAIFASFTVVKAHFLEDVQDEYADLFVSGTAGTFFYKTSKNNCYVMPIAKGDDVTIDIDRINGLNAGKTMNSLIHMTGPRGACVTNGIVQAFRYSFDRAGRLIYRVKTDSSYRIVLIDPPHTLLAYTNIKPNNIINATGRSLPVFENIDDEVAARLMAVNVDRMVWSLARASADRMLSLFDPSPNAAIALLTNGANAAFTGNAAELADTFNSALNYVGNDDERLFIHARYSNRLDIIASSPLSKSMGERFRIPPSNRIDTKRQSYLDVYGTAASEIRSIAGDPTNYLSLYSRSAVADAVLPFTRMPSVPDLTSMMIAESDDDGKRVRIGRLSFTIEDRERTAFEIKKALVIGTKLWLLMSTTSRIPEAYLDCIDMAKEHGIAVRKHDDLLAAGRIIRGDYYDDLVEVASNKLLVFRHESGRDAEQNRFISVDVSSAEFKQERTSLGSTVPAEEVFDISVTPMDARSVYLAIRARSRTVHFMYNGTFAEQKNRESVTPVIAVPCRGERYLYKYTSAKGE
ncbi:MAG: hypothetical protein AABZ39_01955 [Spirochaetota bacterium]